MAFDWNFRNYKRDPLPFLNGSIINDETARNAAIQNAAQNMQGYNPLASTIASEAMEGYQPLNPATQSQLAAGASQAMQGYTPNSVGRPSVPNDMHGGMAQPDLEGYGESLQAAEQAAAQKQEREQTIQKLTSQIAELEQRITANKAKLKDWGGVESQIAAIEARKINKQDPTSVWRWKVDKEDSRRIAAAEKQKGIDQAQANAQFEITNSLSAIRPNAGMDSNTKQRYLDQLANLRTLAQKNKLPTTAIDAKIDEVEGLTKSDNGQTPREKAETSWKGLKEKPGLTSKEVQDAIDGGITEWNPNDLEEAKNLRDKLKKHEAAAQDVKDMKTWIKNTYGKDWSTLSTRLQETYQRLWKKRKGK